MSFIALTGTGLPMVPWSQGSEKQDSVFYLAYGSNLAAETFLGRRGIKPLSQINVVVPGLRLTFDLPGVPYTEPCFSNTNLRHPTPCSAHSGKKRDDTDYDHSLQQHSNDADYHKLRWHKGLVGVVYELTRADYAHVIATEGGGSSYSDILVSCYPLDLSSPTVPNHPSSEAFKAHTLCAPPSAPTDDEGLPDKRDSGRFTRPDPNYAQPSLRYLTLLRDGAAQHHLPEEYLEYLSQIRFYEARKPSQRLGQFIFLSIWMPILSLVFYVIGRVVDGKTGRIPNWAKDLANAVIVAMWSSYDGFFHPLFGDGERTTKDPEHSPVPYAAQRIQRASPHLKLSALQSGSGEESIV
ncbi:MAG: hypothetical protein M1831_000773 [Alyxoria varia]|nr:MAG: hypothetical protein M1831_000773 [Alyxoria varia]